MRILRKLRVGDTTIGSRPYGPKSDARATTIINALGGGKFRFKTVIVVDPDTADAEKFLLVTCLVAAPACKKPGRPKGTKNKPKLTEAASQDQTPSHEESRLPLPSQDDHAQNSYTSTASASSAELDTQNP